MTRLGLKKRGRADQGRPLTPQEALKRLAGQHLRGCLQHSFVILKMDPAISILLDCACFGATPSHTSVVAQAQGREGDISFSGFSAGALLPGSTYSALWDQVAAAADNDHDGAASSRLSPAETSHKKSKQVAYKGRAAAQEGDGATESADAESGQITLSLEEAFFLAYALGALTVSQTSPDTSSTSALTCEELWRTCLGLKPDFKQSYIPFHHFRSKGWVVRPGAQYGVDYVLYSKHPADVHSSYCLLSLMGRKNPSFLSWNDIEAANRNSTQNGKQLLLLYVDEQTTQEQEFPACLSGVTVTPW
ncbi:hypothetical protein WJX75_006707 [Coccomyxa subellipsoidea]|uniref:tRNA-intron lyase n=1 Tax=Coccomyxa subellipsoidea TaxID=248742 RepID=A0ABR2Z4A5_9CHLO